MSLQDEPSLLDRFNLKLEQLDYSFIRDCSDKQTLERIIRVLRSGEEGSYPHLVRYTEDRLRLLHPESRVLIKEKPPTSLRDLPPEQMTALEDELKQWSTNMVEEEKELTRYQVIRAPLPPVRNAKIKDPFAVTNTKPEPNPSQLSADEREALLSLGQKYLCTGNFLQASLQFQKVLACEPLNSVALKGMASIHDQPKSNEGVKKGGVVIEEIL